MLVVLVFCLHFVFSFFRLRDMDVVVSELAAALPVDVMPGGEDPTNVALPQQPLHRCVRVLASGRFL